MSEFTPLSPEELLHDWPPELTHFSASSAKMAVRCPEQWRQRYIIGSIQPPSINLIAGKADHAAIEKSMKQKIETFIDLPVNEVKNAYLEKIENEVAYYGGVGEIEFPKAATAKAAKLRILDEIRETGQQFVANYHTKISPGLQPLQVEEEFALEIPGLPVPLIGYVDLVAATVADKRLAPVGTARLIDRKRSYRTKTSPDPEWTIQAEVYQLAFPLPHEWHITNSRNGTIDTTLVQEVPNPERSIKQTQMIFQQIGHFYKTYGPDNPWPVTGKLHTWACNYCGYRPNCWGWA